MDISTYMAKPKGAHRDDVNEKHSCTSPFDFSMQHASGNVLDPREDTMPYMTGRNAHT